MAPTVLIVDDHAGFRSFARELLEAEGMRVVGEAADGDAAVVATHALRPTLVLLDIQLSGGPDGFEVARRLAETADGPVVVLTSSRQAHDYRNRIAASPARGFLAKDDISRSALEGFLE